MKKLWLIILGFIIIMFIGCSDKLPTADFNNKDQITSGFSGPGVDNEKQHPEGNICVWVKVRKYGQIWPLYQSKVSVRNLSGSFKVTGLLTESEGFVWLWCVPIDEGGEYFIAYADDGIIIPLDYLYVYGNGNSGYQLCYPNESGGNHLLVWLNETGSPGGD